MFGVLGGKENEGAVIVTTGFLWLWWPGGSGGESAHRVPGNYISHTGRAKAKPESMKSSERQENPRVPPGWQRPSGPLCAQY